MDKTCTAPLNCNQTTGLCDLSGSGNWKDACLADGDCNTKYTGLKCSTAKICDCTDSSAMLSLCSDTQVCASGSSPPPPPPGGSCAAWPAAPFPGARPADGTNDNVCKIYAGDCMQHTDVFPAFSNDSCPTGAGTKTWIVGKTKDWKPDAQNPGKNFQCTKAGDWATVPGSGVTDALASLCTYTQS